MFHNYIQIKFTHEMMQNMTHKVLESLLTELPDAYDKITLYGELMVDYLWITNTIADSERIFQVNKPKFIPTWTYDTLLLAQYNKDIGGGNILALDEDIINWLVYKKKTNDNKLSFVKRVPVNKIEVEDFNVSNETEYQYIIFPETENKVGAPMESNLITTDWWDWSITNIYKSNDVDNLYLVDEKNIWLFNTNFSSGNIEQNIDTYVFEGLSKYPKVSIGKRNYLKGKVKSLITKQCNDFYLNSTENEMIDAFKEFIVDGNLKILKDRKGNIYIVQIIDNTFKITDETIQQLTEVEFSWIQVGITDDISVVKE